MATAHALATDEGPPAPVQLGPYQVVGSIAGGGMGIVLRGHDSRDGSLVALKMVRSPTGTDAASMGREIAALERLSHPGIVRLIAHGHANGLPWMAMELLQGQTLCEEIEALWRPSSERAGRRSHRPCHNDDLPTMRARRRPVARRSLSVAGAARPPAAAGRLRAAVGVVVQLCRALDHVHASGLVHRDVKPANVFLGADGRVTLLDFGLVCAMQGTVAADSAEICVGTMEYAAPEQIRGKPVDARADIYALGCLLYELVTGRRTVDTRSSGKIAGHQLLREPSPPSDLVSSVPPLLESLLLAMLAKLRHERPATAGDVADTLTRIAEGCAAA